MLFSPGELVRIVFADENDTYYCNGILALDLNRYLWFKLHEEQYSNVYFLDIKGQSLRVRTLGDRGSQVYSAEKEGKRRFFSQNAKAEGFGGWMLKQLRAKGAERAAIVCPLCDFCEYFSAPVWENVLGEISRADRITGTLILTAPPEAEASADLLLGSPVFGYLNKKDVLSVRDAKPCDMYRVLHRNRPDGYVYLNVPTKETMGWLVRRIIAEEPDRLGDYVLADVMGDYLQALLNSEEFRNKEKNAAPSFEEGFCPMRSIRETLRSDAEWKKLADGARRCLEQNGVRRYVESRSCSYPEADDIIGVTRSADSWAGRCLALEIPESDDEEAIASSVILSQIRNDVRTVRNRRENPRVAEYVERLLYDFHTALADGDYATLRRILFSVQVCLQWIYVDLHSDEEKGILKILDKLNGYITCSSVYFSKQADLKRFKKQYSASGVTRFAEEQLSRSVDAAGKMLEKYESVIQASVVQLSVASSTAAINALADSLDSALEEQRGKPDKKQGEKTKKAEEKKNKKKKKAEEENVFVPQTISEDPGIADELPEDGSPAAGSPDEDEEYEYVLREEDLEYRPPSN